MAEALLVFIKNPRKGKVKTRLAKDIGEQEALNVYKKLMAHTCQVAQQVHCDRYLYYSQSIETDDIWPESEFEKRLQKGEGLGERMRSAFQKVFDEGYQRVVIIGSDCAEISPSHIQEGFQQLSENDFVLGPARDGGYYLMGMQAFHSFVFEGKEWSTDTVLSDTISDIQEGDLSYALLPELNDVDTIEDLERAQFGKQDVSKKE